LRGGIPATKDFKPQINAARPAATKERFKPDLPKRLAALREKGGLKISFRFEKNLTVSSADERLVSPSGMVETPRLQAKMTAAKSTKSTSQGRLRISYPMASDLVRDCRGDRQVAPSSIAGDLTVAPTTGWNERPFSRPQPTQHEPLDWKARVVQNICVHLRFHNPFLSEL
jgi:hypothetical protein